MASITGVASSNVLKFRNVDASTGFKFNLVDVVIGDGTSTYPSNGIPLTPQNFGLVSNLEALIITGTDNAADGYVYKFDQTHQTLRMYVTGTSANAVLNEVATSAAPQGKLQAYATGW